MRPRRKINRCHDRPTKNVLHIREVDRNTKDLFKAKVYEVYRKDRLMQAVFEKLMEFHIEHPNVADVGYIKRRGIQGDSAFLFRTIDMQVRYRFKRLCFSRGDSIRETTIALIRYFIAHPDCIKLN